MINSIESISCSANINLHKINTLNKENELDLDIYDISASNFKRLFYNSYNNEHFSFGYLDINNYPDCILFNNHTYNDSSFNLLDFIIKSYVNITNIQMNCWDPCSLINIQKQIINIKSLKDVCFNNSYTLTELKTLLNTNYNYEYTCLKETTEETTEETTTETNEELIDYYKGCLKMSVIFKCMITNNTWKPIIIHFNFRITDLDNL